MAAAIGADMPVTARSDRWSSTSAAGSTEVAVLCAFAYTTSVRRRRR